MGRHLGNLLPLLLLLAGPATSSLLNKLKPRQQYLNTSEPPNTPSGELSGVLNNDNMCESLQVLEEESGYIDMWSANGTYQNNLDCEWRIFTSPGTVIHFTWMSFDLEGSSNCIYDYVQIQELSSFGEVLTMYNKSCGNVLPMNYTSSSNRVAIKFRTDSTFNTTMPPSSTSAPTTPVWPTIVDWFTTTAQPVNNTSLCSGLPSTFNTTMAPPCTSTPTTPVWPTTLDWVSTTAQPVTNTSWCSGLQMLEEESGYIDMWSANGTYQNNLDCEWRIFTSPGTVIHFTWMSFDLEGSNSCPFDYVQIQELSSFGEVLTINKSCGNVLPVNYTSSSNRVAIKFHTDGSATRRGFSLLYTSSVPANDTDPASSSPAPPTPQWPTASPSVLLCNGTQVSLATRGSISVGSSTNHYEDNQSCEWRLVSPPGSVFRITWHRFDLEEGISAIMTMLKSWMFLQSARYCGHSLPPPLLTSSSTAVIRFQSDGSVAGFGFTLLYENVSDQQDSSNETD
ncbi:Tolloid-like protein 2-like 1 [Homarus americanus]|uniref:Tolloid-like protein 2-like 1 n=1 Tax=Homarus americanus TaxID=6706 RepID=A0A8J5JHG8_HOMAM|nr:Tolloid-like protein 2-like 1 [Homarus americanus]